jgi:hypothetical protein
MNHNTYINLIDEDIQWLLKQPRTLERDHIISILQKESYENDEPNVNIVGPENIKRTEGYDPTELKT